MDTIDEQLDHAVAKVNDLTGQLAAAQESLAAVTAEKATLEAVNAELTDNLTAAKDKLASQEVDLREAHALIEQLKAEAKTAEQRAAEFYGAGAGSGRQAGHHQGSCHWYARRIFFIAI